MSKLRPIPGKREEVGLYEEDIRDLSAKVGDWVKVEYTKSDSEVKKIDSKIRMVDREQGWRDRLIWINKKQLTDLEIYNIGSAGPRNPPNIEVEVTKYTFYWSPAFKSAVLTFILTFFGLVCKVGAEIEAYKLYFGIGGFIVALTAPLFAVITVYLQKQ